MNMFFLSFISVYSCSSVVTIVFVSGPGECYIYSRHAGVNSGIYAMRRLTRWLLLLALLACGLYLEPAGILMATTARTQKTPRTIAAPAGAKLSPEGARWVAQTLKKMTLDEKIGQLFAVWCYGGFPTTESLAYKDLLRDVEEKHIGSFALQTQGSPLGIERSQVRSEEHTSELQSHLN